MISEINAFVIALLNPDFSKLSKPEPTKQELVAYARHTQTGLASWYGVGDGYHGQQAADGSIFNAYGLSAAHATLPFGTKVRVTNLDTGASVIVRITDRGGFNKLGRIIDLSYGAAKAIGGVSAGVFPVRIEVL